MVNHPSPSRMGNFSKCPAKFGYKAKNYPQMPTDDTARAFGIMLHNVQERFYMMIPANPDNKGILDVANMALQYEWLPRFQSLLRTAKTSISNFIIFERGRLVEAKKRSVPYKKVAEMPEEYEHLTKEEVWKLPRNERIKRMSVKVYKSEDRYLKLVSPLIEVDLGNKLFHAIIDFYWEGQLIDWKFGKTQTVYSEHKLQLSIEKYILESNDYPVNYTGLGFPRKASKPLKVSTHTETVLKRYRKRLRDAIEKDSFPRKKTYLCWNCEYYTTCVAEEKGKNLWSDIFRDQELLL